MTIKRSVLGLIFLGLLTIAPNASAQNFFEKATSAFKDLGDASFAQQVLGSDEIAAGLREALKVGTQTVAAQVGANDGFNSDPKIHIPLPATLAKVQSVLRNIGMADMADELELKMNRGAEAAAGQTREVFWQAISEMTLEDVEKIYQGPDDAATQYFKQKMSPALADRLEPIIDRSLSEVGAVRSYDDMMRQYGSIPFVPDVKADLTTYVVGRAMEGIFYYVAEEEAAIRNNPAKRTTEILQKVFGAN